MERWQMVLRQLLPYPSGAGRDQSDSAAPDHLLHPSPGARLRDPGHLLADAVVFVRGDRRRLAAGPLPLSACGAALYRALSGTAPTSRGGIPARRTPALRQSLRATPRERTGCLYPSRSAPAGPGRADGTAARAATCGGGRRGRAHRRRGRVRRRDEGPAPRAGQLMSVAPTAGTAPSSRVVHRPRRSWWRIDRHDVVWLIALTLVAGVLRFGSPFFLDIFSHPGSAAPISAWGIGHNYQDPSLPGLGKPNDIAPNSPFVFDELYFANDALLGKDYFDPEPPLAKLLIAIGIKLFGFNSFGWRFMPALFGTALIPLMYLLARQLLAVRFFAIAVGVLTAFDGLTFVESRTAVIDIIPITLVVLAYLLFHLHLNADTVARRRWMIVLTGITLGLAIGAKWTTLAAYATIIVILALRLVLRWTRYDGATGGIALLSLALLPAIVYGLSFTRYVTITHGITNLPQPALSFMPLHVSPGAVWREIAEWHRQTWLYHINLKADHIFYSPWWSWPLDFRPVVYYYTGNKLGIDQSTGSALVAEIFNLGNPLIWWAATFSVVGIAIGLPTLIQGYRSRHDLDSIDAERRDPAGPLDQRLYASVFILVAFITAWLPLSLVPRGLFLYHMLGGLPAMFLALALALTYLRSRSVVVSGVAVRLNGAVPVYAYLIMVIGFFLYFYPLWTGLPLTADALNSHVWFAFVKPWPNWCLCYWTSPG